MTVKHSSTQNCKRFLRSIGDNPVIASLAPEQPLDLIRDRSVELAEQLQAPLMEKMPAAVIRDVFSGLRRRKVEVPVIASGLLSTREQVHRVLEAGATAVSASCPALWRNHFG